MPNPSTPPTKRPPTIPLVCLALTVVVALEALLLYGVAAKFAHMFQEFTMQLPLLSRFFIGSVGYVVALTTCALGTALSGVGWARKTRRVEIAGLAIVGVVTVLLPVLALIGFYLPIFEIADSISE